MKKDIPFHPATGVDLAIVRESRAGETEWSVYLINKNLISLTTVMINSKGYGQINGEMRKTSVLRHVIEKLEAQAVAKVEPILPDLFQLTNEFWVSYYILDQIFDKKFIFLPGSISDEKVTYIPELDLHGILHTK
ncbi:hypothetical protein [Lunatibacter salilacus]|uniref:hypothetical protein n=1 Tax=Lunatibacter salilacus TaxID=2483804 RepID=UPI00131EB437|nr:hypothetical protein [Lunatibacter salilacus]